MPTGGAMLKKLKDLSLMKKILSGFGFVILLLMIVSFMATSGIEGIVKNAKDIITGNDLKGMISQKEVDHLNWSAQVSQLLTDHTITELKVETNDHKCGLGQWLYGESRRQAETLIPELKPIFKAIEAPHAELHASAVEIKEVYVPANPMLPGILNEKIIDHLKWAAVVRDVFLNNKKRLDVQIDSTQCALGKWLKTDQASQAYSSGDQNFKKNWSKMLNQHQVLHASAVKISSALKRNNQSVALNIFKQQTVSALSGTLKSLAYLKDKATRDLHGLNLSNRIYSEKTQPNLKKVQTLFGEVKSTVSQNLISDQEMLSAASRTKLIIVVSSVFALLSGILIAVLLSRYITNRVLKAVKFSEIMAKGDFSESVISEQNDEVGEMISSLNNMSNSLGTMVSGINENTISLESSSAELSAIATQMSSSTESTVEKSNSVSAAAEEMNVNMTSVAAAMEQAVCNIDTVASSSEEMSCSIDEIFTDMEKAKSNTNHSVSAANTVSDNIKTLSQEADAIETVTETITAISDKTNLLALNATIEAARAGDAGKGFAVVANEIKALANQTALATTDIGNKLKAIQSSTHVAVTGVEDIVHLIDDINGVVTAVSSAMEQQKLVTREITENISQASVGIKEITENVSQTSQAASQVANEIGMVSGDASEVSNSTAQLQQSAEELSRMAVQLKGKMAEFKV